MAETGAQTRLQKQIGTATLNHGLGFCSQGLCFGGLFLHFGQAGAVLIQTKDLIAVRGRVMFIIGQAVMGKAFIPCS